MNYAVLQYKLQSSEFDPLTVPGTQIPYFTEKAHTLEHVNIEHTITELCLQYFSRQRLKTFYMSMQETKRIF